MKNMKTKLILATASLVMAVPAYAQEAEDADGKTIVVTATRARRIARKSQPRSPFKMWMSFVVTASLSEPTSIAASRAYSFGGEKAMAMSFRSCRFADHWAPKAR